LGYRVACEINPEQAVLSFKRQDHEMGPQIVGGRPHKLAFDDEFPDRDRIVGTHARPGALGWRRGSSYRGSRVMPVEGRDLSSRQTQASVMLQRSRSFPLVPEDLLSDTERAISGFIRLTSAMARGDPDAPRAAALFIFDDIPAGRRRRRAAPARAGKPARQQAPAAAHSDLPAKTERAY
jgi:hypothetical protein